MMVFWIIAFALVITYILWIGLFYYGWIRTPAQSSLSDVTNTFVSILVPVRNEELNILMLLEDLTKQDYPQNLIEIIIIDDHSTDLTPDIIRYFAKRHGNIRYIGLSNDEEGKKTALRKGVFASRFAVILTIDADCKPSPLWVWSMVNCFNKTKADLVAGPVLMQGDRKFFSKFQKLEYYSLLGSTAGSLYTGNPVMCSSANLGFRKDTYFAAGGHYNDQVLSSGDDVFLLLAMHKAGIENLCFLKSNDGIVTTKAQSELAGFFKQRKRWTSKSRHYKSKASVFTAILIFIINFYFVICLFSGILFYPFLLIGAFIFISKSLIDFPFLFSVTTFFRENKLMKYFPVIQFLYFFYISFTVITAFTGVFYWKGRIVKK